MQTKLASKFGIIALLAILLMIPLGLISSKIDERASYLAQAKQNVSDSWTASQVVLPSLLVLPYEVHSKEYVTDKVSNELKLIERKTRYNKLIVPDKLSLSAQVDNSVRHKGIYNVPVYTSNLTVTGEFDGVRLKRVKQSLSRQHEHIEFSAPYLSTVVSDPRGINGIPVLNWQNEEVAFKPSSRVAEKYAGVHAFVPMINEKGINEFSFKLELRGMERLSFIPVGLDNQIQTSSSWPHPQFTGDFLPTSSSISAQGYQAQWHVTSFANNIEEKVLSCENRDCDALFQSSLGVKHIETVDVYVQSERTVKYGILFIGLSFITFFIFETLMKLPIHPIQYGLVGLANAIFYLLLISLSENIQFAQAYFVASLCCIALLTFYLKPILKNNTYVYGFLTVLGLLYGVLYIIINMEDLAMLMGAFLTFFVLAVVMYTTRNIDWYQLGDGLNNEPK